MTRADASRGLAACLSILLAGAVAAQQHLGPEFQVNSYTLSAQYDPAMAGDSNGDFVVVWTSDGQDGSSKGVFAKRFTALGLPQGVEFRVNSHTSGLQYRPAVARDADGDFVVAWKSFDGSFTGIFARRFDATGAPQDAEFRVHSSTADSRYPEIGMDADGDFVVVWNSFPLGYGSGSDVFASRFDASGSLVAAEFQINSHTSGDQIYPVVAMDSDGDFVVAWQSFGQDARSPTASSCCGSYSGSPE